MADSELMLVLAAQAWQITSLIAVVAAMNRWLGKSRPHLVHALWLVVLVKCVTPPLWSSPSGLFCWLQSPREVVAQQPGVEIKSPSRSWTELLDAAHDLEQFRSTESDDRGLSDMSDEPIESLLSVRELSAADVRPQIIGASIHWPRALLGLWITASFGVIGVAIFRWLRCWRMLRNAPQRECPELSEQLNSLARQLGLRRRVRLIVTESRLGPAVIGLFRTTVLLPALIVDRLTERSRHDIEPVKRCQSGKIGAASAPQFLAGITTTGGLTPPRSPILSQALRVMATLHPRSHRFSLTSCCTFGGATCGSGCCRRWLRRCGGVIRWCGG